MRNPFSIKTLLLAVLVLFSTHSVIAVEITPGMMLSNSCAACHGTDGKSPGAIPSINGKSKRFLSRTLKEFRAGTRESTVMGRHAKGYSDEEIKMIAEYFSHLK